MRRRLYRGRTDLPKSNREREFALTPPARDVLLKLPEREGFVFRNKSGEQLTQPTLTAYWKEVKARAGLGFDFYMASKHYGCWYMKVKLGLPNHVIAAQAGWVGEVGREDGRHLRPLRGRCARRDRRGLGHGATRPRRRPDAGALRGRFLIRAEPISPITIAVTGECQEPPDIGGSCLWAPGVAPSVPV